MSKNDCSPTTAILGYADGANQMGAKQFKAKYLGGDLRLGTVPLLGQMLGGLETLVEVASEGYLDLSVIGCETTYCRAGSYETRDEGSVTRNTLSYKRTVRYTAAKVEQIYLEKNVWQAMGMLDVGPTIYVVRVRCGEPAGVALEVRLSMRRDQQDYFVDRIWSYSFTSLLRDSGFHLLGC